MRYDVNVFAVVWAKLPGIEATSPTAAIAAALQQTDLHCVFDGAASPSQPETGWAEEISHYLVETTVNGGQEKSWPFLDGAHVEATRLAVTFGDEQFQSDAEALDAAPPGIDDEKGKPTAEGEQ